MRLVVTIDGELLASLGYNAGMLEQKAAIARMVEAMGNLLLRGDEIVICHGNAFQVGSMLLRSEAASHMIYVLPLDVCGADTQGATGYMLQQALQNWFEQHDINRPVVTLVTQVVVEEPEPGLSQASKGVGPYFDSELAHAYRTTRGWELALAPGFGYQRIVPLLMPRQIVEGVAIRALVERGVVTICAGGGGVPVRLDAQGMRIGVEAVVDKAYTTVLLARETQAESIIFVTPLEDLLGVLGPDTNQRVRSIGSASLDDLVQSIPMDVPIRRKLIASRDFLQAGGKSVLIIPPEELSRLPEASYGVYLTSGEGLVLNNDSFYAKEDFSKCQKK